MKLKIKKLAANAVIPKYAKPGDAGMDLTATTIDFQKGQIHYGTGIAMEIPEGYVGLLFPRSSVYKTKLELSNSVGVIDSGYRGEVRFIFNREKLNDKFYKIGDRVGQLVLLKLPEVEIEEVDKLSKSERGDGGFGSSGR